MNDSIANIVSVAEPPPGWVTNFANPKDVYHTIALISHSVCLVMITLFFAIRLYVKMVIKRGEILLEDCRSIILMLSSRACGIQTDETAGFCVASWVRAYSSRE